MLPSTFPLRQLGRDGPEVPALGWGMMGLSMGVYGKVDSEEEQFKILDRAYEIGARNWDTSDLYGASESIIGKWFKLHPERREEIFLATKFGFIKGAAGFQVDSSAEFCKKACANSLEALGIDSIDLYYIHHVNPATPIEETMRALADLKAEGKIKHIGISAISSTTLRRAARIAPVAAVQVDYGPFCLDAEGPAGTDLLKTCRELGVAIVAATPLGRGMLTTTFIQGEAVSDARVAMPRFQENNRDQNIEVVKQFQQLAQKKKCTMPQLALAWLLKQGDDIIPIPGTKKIKYLEENWGALDVKLTDEEEAEIRSFASNAKISGSTLPPQYQDYNYRDTVEEA